MSRLYKGNVSVLHNTKNEISLTADVNGVWNSTNAKALYAKMQELSKAMNIPINKWSCFIADGGTDVLLMADRYGKPRITILPPEGEGQAKSKVVKLA